MFEYVVVCAIVLFLETTNSTNKKANNLDVKTCYDELIKLIKTNNIPLPLTSRSLKELQSGVKKISAIRRNMK